MIGTISSLRGPSYPIPYSLRFRSSASAYLSRTPAASGSLTAWTMSMWVKRGTITASGYSTLFGALTGVGSTTELSFAPNDTLAFIWNTSNYIQTSAVFRDPSAWYHVVCVWDSNNATPADRAIIYVNNVRQSVTLGGSYPTVGQQSFWNRNLLNTICRFNSIAHFDGYLAEVHFIDGQALTPASFGNISSATGVWAPKKYTGTYGTNGFYLKFADNSAASATAIGKDSSGNSNNWTPTNISMVAGSTFDSMTDTPTPYGDAAYYSGWNPSYGLQFRSSASTYLSRTASSPTNNQKFTWSGWIKRGSVGASDLFGAATGASNYTDLAFTSNNNITYVDFATGTRAQLITTQAFSDLSSWYHIVLAADVTNAVAADRTILYVNGSRITQFTTNTTYSTSVSPYINQNGVSQQIGGLPAATFTSYFNGVLADINFIDGQALTPAAFAETDSTGTWVPKAYTGTYGTNGFYLNFADRSAITPAAIGNDASSNSNNWQPNNMVIADAIDYGVSSVKGNYAVLNPLDFGGESVKSIITDGNLKGFDAGSASFNSTSVSTIGVTSGKFYCEFTSITSFIRAGILYGLPISSMIAAGIGYYGSNGIIYKDNVSQGTFATYTTNDVIGLALDADAKTIAFYKNNTLITTVSYTSTNTVYFGAIFANQTNSGINANFGQRPFAYTPPAGFKALCTHNLPVPTIKKAAAYMAATTYTGTGVGRTITNTVNNTSFQPDLVWIKNRTAGTSHVLFDSTRGSSKYLSSDTTTAETTNANTLTAFNENGFSLGTDTTLVNSSTVNANSYVAWQWKEGAAAGLDIVSYTGTGANTTIAHNLGVAPAMIIVKRSQTGGTGNWQVRHTSIAAANSIQLNGSAGATAAATVWNSTAPTSSVFSIGTSTDVNAAGVGYVAYCFAEIAGYSKFGSYAANGSADGPFVYCGFRPKFVMFKSTSIGTRWIIIDSTRDSFNQINNTLSPTFNAAEYVDAGWKMDFTSNGFKVRSYASGDTEWNYPGYTYIFAAFAEVPSKYALAR